MFLQCICYQQPFLLFGLASPFCLTDQPCHSFSCVFLYTMFFRRKQKKQPDSPLIRTSPSLPELNSQGIPWPEDLVDLEAIRAEESHEDDQERSGTPTTSPVAGGAKTSFQGPMVFHKPFRAASVSSEGHHEGKISALYMNPGQPATFDSKRVPPSHTRYSQRRPRIPSTFNLMVSSVTVFPVDGY